MGETFTGAEWVEAIDQHYLSEYLPAGGSSVKFAVCFPEVGHREVAAKLRSRAADRGFLVADIDASQTKVHLIEQVFGRIADQIPWAALIDRTLSRFARDNQWRIPDSFTDEGLVEQLDRHNQLGVQQISMVLQRQISENIFLNRELAKDFRVAMYWLARTRLGTGLNGTADHRNLTDWMGGRVRLLNELKDYQIFSKVVRANARHLLGSLLVMVREAGYPGLVVALDGFRLLEGQRAGDGSLHYTKAALFDAYEVLREFVDSTDDLDGLFFSVFVPPSFLDINRNNPQNRGIGIYNPLLSRVYDELRGQRHANPLTAMTRIRDLPEVSI